MSVESPMTTSSIIRVGEGATEVLMLKLLTTVCLLLVVFASTTTKRLPLVRGGRLVLFARATRPSQAASGCTGTQPLVAGRLVSIRTANPVD